MSKALGKETIELSKGIIAQLEKRIRAISLNENLTPLAKNKEIYTLNKRIDKINALYMECLNPKPEKKKSTTLDRLKSIVTKKVEMACRDQELDFRNPAMALCHYKINNKSS